MQRINFNTRQKHEVPVYTRYEWERKPYTNFLLISYICGKIYIVTHTGVFSPGQSQGLLMTFIIRFLRKYENFSKGNWWFQHILIVLAHLDCLLLFPSNSYLEFVVEPLGRRDGINALIKRDSGELVSYSAVYHVRKWGGSCL